MRSYAGRADGNLSRDGSCLLGVLAAVGGVVAALVACWRLGEDGAILQVGVT